MADKFLFIVDPLERLNVKTDTTLALMQEACARGIECFATEIVDISLRDGRLQFSCASVFLSEGYMTPPRYGEEKKMRWADEFAVVFMRKDPPVDQRFFTALLMLRCFNPQKTLMINNPDGLLIANEKLFGQQNVHRYFPATAVSADAKVLQNFIIEHGRMVVKPLFGAGGSGVLVFEAGDKNLKSALELLTSNFTSPIMVQAYVPNARLGDKRVLLVGGDPVGAVLRVPHGEDHRANFHAGGSAKAASLTERELQIIKDLKPALLAWGLHFVGLDIIDGFLTEINVTSPTCLLEMEALGGKRLRVQVLDYIEKQRASLYLCH